MTHFRRNVIVAVIVIFPVSVTVSNAVQFRVLETTNKVSFAFIGVFMLLCYLITFFAYFKVYRIIRQHQQQIHETQSQGFEQSTTNLAKYKRSVKSVLYIFTSFSLTFFPVFAVVAFMLSTEDISCLEASAAYYIAHVIYFLSLSLNPALYVWRMNDIRNSESSQEFILLECRVNTSLDHHSMTVAKGLLRTDRSLKDHGQQNFPFKEKENSCVFIYLSERPKNILARTSLSKGNCNKKYILIAGDFLFR